MGTPGHKGSKGVGLALVAAFGCLALAGPARAETRVERIEGGGWSLIRGDGAPLGGKLEVKRSGDAFNATIVEPPPNECFDAGTTLYKLSGREPEYTGTEYYAFVRKTSDGTLKELRADEKVDPDYTCTGAFQGHPAKMTVSTFGNLSLRFSGGATDSFLPLIWSKPRKDSDGDGLLDDEETSGINIPYDPRTGGISPEVEVDLPAMGADPMHKDLFVEVDEVAGHPFDPQAVQFVTHDFAQAHVANPDGRRGISIHIDAGPDTLMDGKTGRMWGELSQSDEIPFDPVTGSLDGAGNYVWDEYEGIKQKYFDNCPAGGGVCQSARSLAFRYMVMIHRHPARGVGGESRGIPGIDAVNALQCSGVRTLCNDNWDIQAAGFMHELGHNLGLGHGGPGDNTNYKPNYFSVMNYSYTFGIPTTSGDPAIFYSPFDDSEAPTLNERHLAERRGVQAPTGRGGLGLVSIFYCGRRGLSRTADANRPADFNCNGRKRGTVSADINKDGEKGALRSADDWQALKLDPRFLAPFSTPDAFRPQAGPSRTANIETPIPDTRPVLYHDHKKPKLRIKRRRHGRKVVLKIRARDNKHLDRLIVDVGKATDDDYIEKQPKRKRKPVRAKVKVPKKTKVGVVALDIAGNSRERRFRAR